MSSNWVRHSCVCLAVATVALLSNQRVYTSLYCSKMYNPQEFSSVAGILMNKWSQLLKFLQYFRFFMFTLWFFLVFSVFRDKCLYETVHWWWSASLIMDSSDVFTTTKDLDAACNPFLNMSGRHWSFCQSCIVLLLLRTYMSLFKSNLFNSNTLWIL